MFKSFRRGGGYVPYCSNTFLSQLEPSHGEEDKENLNQLLQQN